MVDQAKLHKPVNEVNLMPILSIVIPAYNAERTILETIASVQKQTFSDFELIVIDDGSSDQTLALLHSVADERLRIFSYKNGGVSVARNRGMSHASGEFIAFIDADDLWTPDKLELQLAALQQHPEAGVAYSWTSYMEEQGKYFHTDEPITFEGNVHAELLVSNFLSSGSNPLIRKQAIESVGEFDSTCAGCADWDYWLRLAARWPFVVVPKHQILYRLSSSSMSSNSEMMEKHHLIVIERAFKSATLELQPLKKQSMANVYQFLAHLYLTRTPGATGAKQASRKLQEAIRLHSQILLYKKTQVLVVKLLLIRLLSPRIASHLLQRFSTLRATRI